jgi:serine/threonine-protein kinase
MGVVYEAVNTWTDRRVAVKLLHPSFSTDEEVVDRFVREAKSASRVTHPSIVDILDLGQDPRDGALFMVQEFITGDTLRQHLAAKKRLSPGEAAEILLPIMDALAAAHEAGVIHRDVKPENIIVSVDHAGQRVPKLIDFGISKVTVDGVAAMLQTGRALGTPVYMSPEQLRAQESIDGRSDVWAVGVVLFELLAGRRPFDAAGHNEAVVQILTSQAPSIGSFASEVPDDIARVIARALERDRESRFVTMRAMRDAFVACSAMGEASGASRGASREAVASGMSVTMGEASGASRGASREPEASGMPAAMGEASGASRGASREPVASGMPAPIPASRDAASEAEGTGGVGAANGSMASPQGTGAPRALHEEEPRSWRGLREMPGMPAPIAFGVAPPTTAAPAAGARRWRLAAAVTLCAAVAGLAVVTRKPWRRSPSSPVSRPQAAPPIAPTVEPSAAVPIQPSVAVPPQAAPAAAEPTALPEQVAAPAHRAPAQAGSGAKKRVRRPPAQPDAPAPRAPGVLAAPDAPAPPRPSLPPAAKPTPPPSKRAPLLDL